MIHPSRRSRYWNANRNLRAGAAFVELVPAGIARGKPNLLRFPSFSLGVNSNSGLVKRDCKRVARHSSNNGIYGTPLEYRGSVHRLPTPHKHPHPVPLAE
jgi:hypothetical protein